MLFLATPLHFFVRTTMKIKRIKKKKQFALLATKKCSVTEHIIFTTYILFFLMNFIEVWQKIKIYKHKKN